MPLIRHTGEFPPGGFAFIDSRTNMRFNGTEADFEGQVAKIAQHRLGNYGAGKIYDANKPDDGKFLDLGYIRTELEDYTCRRLGNDRRFCVGADEPEKLRLREKYYQQKDQGLCPKCGKEMEEILCPTCGGRKITGYKCSCGFEVLK